MQLLQNLTWLRLGCTIHQNGNHNEHSNHSHGTGKKRQTRVRIQVAKSRVEDSESMAHPVHQDDVGASRGIQ